MRPFRLAPLLIALLLAACDSLLPPSPTPTVGRVISGVTIEPSATFFPRQPTYVPFDEYLAGQNDPTAAALPAGGALPPLVVGSTLQTEGTPAPSKHTIQITAMDGAQLPGDFYVTPGERLPGVLLLAPDRTAWGDFPAALNAAGFAVLSMDLREGALLDFTVMLQALNSGDADPANLAVIGANAGADVALLGCAGDMLCDAAVLLSPSGDPALVNAMPAYNPRPILLAASEDDAAAFAAITAIQTAASGSVQFQPFTNAGSGAVMLVNRPDFADLLIAWLRQVLVR